jgi:polyisoprenoid-binding protein YceI
MLKRIFILFYLMILLSSSAFAPQLFYNVSIGSITFRSDAALELIKASSNQLKGIFDPVKKQFAFSINIRSFSGFNSPTQQEHFNENYLESDKFPHASFEGKIIEDIDFHRDGLYYIRAKGNLNVHGVVQERIIKCELNIKNKIVNIKSNFTVLLSDHNITIPKVVHEKLASEIKLEVKAEMIEK